MERSEIIKTLLTNGSEKVNNLKIKNVTITELEKYVRVSFTTDKKVKRYVDDSTGNFVEGESNIVVTSLFAVIATLRDNEKLSFAANHILTHPHSLELLLNQGYIDVILEPVAAGTEYKNPWSEKGDITLFTHDTIIAHVVNLVPGPMAKFGADAIAMDMLGINK